ncbi:DUF3293 domain-containing protein [Idiomarina sp. HP20-50]|uniref:DUF3293 domain-containing protein n=1 Tax=Idiomarina sp. HP20-50 TaxID=3070813 RepID=UPI00294B702C|nr:DUF3293 domain-containing protein [Idiomarina sp. HP20-50]MDV6314774.1 DUF3293 domain-containing protein [Idiomarina sp. HP20-50]
MDKKLLANYKNTNYRFMADGQQVTLTIGQKNVYFDRLCDSLNQRNGAFITAFNPHSQLLSIKENRERNKQLESTLREIGEVHYFRGEGQDRNKQWPAEESYMVLGLKQQTVIDLARQYQQNALVWIEYQQAAVLITV